MLLFYFFIEKHLLQNYLLVLDFQGCASKPQKLRCSVCFRTALARLDAPQSQSPHVLGQLAWWRWLCRSPCTHTCTGTLWPWLRHKIQHLCALYILREAMDCMVRHFCCPLSRCSLFGWPAQWWCDPRLLYCVDDSAGSSPPQWWSLHWRASGSSLCIGRPAYMDTVGYLFRMGHGAWTWNQRNGIKFVHMTGLHHNGWYDLGTNCHWYCMHSIVN